MQMRSTFSRFVEVPNAIFDEENDRSGVRNNIVNDIDDDHLESLYVIMASDEVDRRPALAVIVGGLPRTGTTSMTKALEILLKGPVFDGGAASYLDDADMQRRMLELARHCPMKTLVDRTFVQYRLAELTEGCVASSDQPGCYFLEELLHLYPEAKVICTVRDRESWWASYSALWQSIHDLSPWSWLSPSLRRFCIFSHEFWKRVPQAVGIPPCEPWPMVNQEGLYEAHAEYVRRVVPPHQLFLFNVRDGWEPLCKILNVDIPIEPFPHMFPRSWLKNGNIALIAQLKRRLAILVVKFAPFATRVRQGYVPNQTEKDLGLHLENALKGVLLPDRWPKSAVDVAVTVLEGEDDQEEGDRFAGLGLLNLLAAAINVAMAALADAKIDCLDLLAAGVGAVVPGPNSKSLRVLDPAALEHDEIQASCVVGYLSSRDEIVEVWSSGSISTQDANASVGFDDLVDAAVAAARGAQTVLKEALLESVTRNRNALKNATQGELNDVEMET
ncbi:hypothetical protein AYL99_08159 [Fonsecaea erecta]|uniref:Exoribonuclease phosphorolytic domain-containing protein n=1 Tax=Fonsecaea erecta TaxID=1367422 RepID=A0A178ZD73_9EURO|nr:hypothetical protein AYL99_08159 [Fonsecaea erecta]OAP57421.1 hypothetical protein AYL99_08159 [Fonsecaea erecta]